MHHTSVKIVRRKKIMKMRAAIYNGIHNVVLSEAEKPEVIPGAIVVKNIRSGICGTDLHAYNINGPEVGIVPGNQFGHEMSGVVEEVGEGVEGIKKGTHVFINPCTFKEPTAEMSVLMCCDMAGAFSEYVRVDKPVSEYNVFELPEDLDWDIAAMIEPISVALNGILKCRPKKDDKVVIYGGGIIGLCALACLKCMGVEEVIVTARNPFRSAKVEELGGILCNTKLSTVPDFVMDKWGKLTGNNGEDTWNADIVIDCAGYAGAFEEIMKYAKCGSQICVIALGTSEEKLTESNLCYKDISIHGSFAYTPETNRKAIDLVVENPAAFAPIATATYGLSEIAKAFEEANVSSKNVKVLIDHSK
jgi:threonine dehydrogenase-like Zn-dependent dehydrogenase